MFLVSSTRHSIVSDASRIPARAPQPEYDRITVRRSTPDDARSIRRLAALDDARLPAGPALVAEVDGQLVAAAPLAGSAVIADPFRRTSELVAMLELRRRQMGGAAARRPAATALRPVAA